MKKIILSAIAMVAFGAAAQAQTFTFGPKAGVNFSNFSGDGDSDGHTGYYVGAFVDIDINEKFHIQPELLYSNEGAKDATVDYVRIPVMFKYYLIEGLNIQAGPQIAFKAANEEILDDAIKSMDFGLGFGAAYELSSGLFVDARYNLGLSNISEAEVIDFKNTNFQLGLGYRF